MYAFLCLGHLSCHCSIWMNSYCTFCVSFALLDIPSAIPTMHVFLVSRNIRKSLTDIWWYFAYLKVQEIEMPRWVIEIQFRFSKKAIKIGQNLPVDLTLFCKFQTNWEISSNVCGLFRKPKLYKQKQNSQSSTSGGTLMIFLDTVHECCYMLLNSCLMFISCV